MDKSFSKKRLRDKNNTLSQSSNGSRQQHWEYRTGTAIWTTEEEKKLKEAEKKFPIGKWEHDKRCIMIAAELPAKSVRDVAYKIKWREHEAMEAAAAMAAKSAVLEAVAASSKTSSTTSIKKDFKTEDSSEKAKLASQTQIELQLQTNAQLIQKMRQNLGEGRLEANIELMKNISENIEDIHRKVNCISRLPYLGIGPDMSAVENFGKRKKKRRKRKKKNNGRQKE